MTGEREARMGLCALMPMGSPVIARAVAGFGAVDVWEGLRHRPEPGPWGLRARGLDLAALSEATERAGARFIIPGDDEWPLELQDLACAEAGGQTGQPYGLWVRGGPLPEAAGGVAVVGARACSAYGEHAALTLAADLAAGGRAIISGLAYGIDAAAHRGALGVGGLTVGVLASGIDTPYPTSNAELMSRVIRGGVLVSESPPGARPLKAAFLARNRIIAALAAAVVIVEATLRSGAKNTTTWAHSLGRPVLAVPGPLTSSLSATPHNLIRDGEAVLVTCAAEVEAALAPLGSAPEPPRRGRDRPIDTLAPELRELREAVPARQAISVGELAVLTGQPMMRVLAGVGELVATGWLERTPDGLVSLPRRRAATGPGGPGCP